MSYWTQVIGRITRSHKSVPNLLVTTKVYNWSAFAEGHGRKCKCGEDRNIISINAVSVSLNWTWIPFSFVSYCVLFSVKIICSVLKLLHCYWKLLFHFFLNLCNVRKVHCCRNHCIGDSLGLIGMSWPPAEVMLGLGVKLRHSTYTDISQVPGYIPCRNSTKPRAAEQEYKA